MKALVKRMRAVIGELSQLIDVNDGRWLNLGLNLPGAVPLPELVGGVVGGTGRDRSFGAALEFQRARTVIACSNKWWAWTTNSCPPSRRRNAART